MTARDHNTLEFYLPPYRWGWRVEHPPKPHDVVAWRKKRGKYWTSWTGYSRLYSWSNIKKWVTRRGDTYQVATAAGQIWTVRRP